MALGAATIIASLIGAGANYLIGRKQAKDAEGQITAAREDILANTGPTAELLAGVDEQKGLITRAGDLGQQSLDRSMTGFLDALASGDQTLIASMTPGAASNQAIAAQQLGLQTAQQIAGANQPIIAASQDAQNVRRSLGEFDFQQGQQAFQQGRQTQMDAFGQVLNTPMDLATLYTANPDAFGNLFPGISAGMGKDGIKTAQAGVYTGGGINMRTLRDLLAALPEKEKVILEEEVAEVVNQDDAEDKAENYQTEEEKRKAREREVESGRGDDTDVEYPTANMGVKTEDYMGGGNTLSQILRPGESFKTGGKEDHDAQEYNIEDAKTGEVVAKTTGQETHMVNEDGTLTVMNSEQTESIHDAFKDVDVDMVLKALKGNPQKSQVRELLSALNKVYSQKQFQS
tara:strand:- start:1163 stop:2368 length:1206 start_codon:yes stop_codon:yes gene_type:complete